MLALVLWMNVDFGYHLLVYLTTIIANDLPHFPAKTSE